MRRSARRSRSLRVWSAFDLIFFCVCELGERGGPGGGGAERGERVSWRGGGAFSALAA